MRQDRLKQHDAGAAPSSKIWATLPHFGRYMDQRDRLSFGFNRRFAGSSRSLQHRRRWTRHCPVCCRCKGAAGKLRVYVYGDDPTMFLKRKKRLKRVNVDADQRDPVRICIRVPKPGRYAVIVQHDINGNKRADWSDGGGASRNPNVTLLRLRPKYEETSFEVRGVERLDIRLKYRQGFKIAPLS
jgi:uncharacterized protein (DUF2141 family)